MQNIIMITIAQLLTSVIVNSLLCIPCDIFCSIIKQCRTCNNFYGLILYLLLLWKGNKLVTHCRQTPNHVSKLPVCNSYNYI